MSWATSRCSYWPSTRAVDRQDSHDANGLAAEDLSQSLGIHQEALDIKRMKILTCGETEIARGRLGVHPPCAGNLGYEALGTDHAGEGTKSLSGLLIQGWRTPFVREILLP